MSIAFITGASEGIGEAFAERLAKEGYDLVITARNTQKIEKLAEKLQRENGVKVKAITMDVRKREEIEKAVSSLKEGWEKIDVLVNNAGLALTKDPIHEGNPDDWDTMIDTNIKGLLYCTRAIVPLILKQPHGHVVNIGSVAGDMAYPGGGIYCATKSAVEALSDALRAELVHTPVRVTNIKPGITRTQFSLTRFSGDREKADSIYEGIESLRAEDVADALAYILKAPKHVQISSITLVPTQQANVFCTHKVKRT